MQRPAPLRKFPSVHPGTILLEELETRKWTPHDLAQRSGLARVAVERVLDCWLPVDALAAVRLGDALGVSPEFFLNLQRNYDLHRVYERIGWTKAARARKRKRNKV